MIFGLIMVEGLSVGSTSPSYKGYRYPVEIIAHCVWLYFRFPLSFREVEEMMLERGRGRLPRDRPALVSEVRAGLRQRPAPTACADGGPGPVTSGTWTRPYLPRQGPCRDHPNL
jgi:hypothetical protein